MHENSVPPAGPVGGVEYVVFDSVPFRVFRAVGVGVVLHQRVVVVHEQMLFAVLRAVVHRLVAFRGEDCDVALRHERAVGLQFSAVPKIFEHQEGVAAFYLTDAVVFEYARAD